MWQASFFKKIEILKNNFFSKFLNFFNKFDLFLKFENNVQLAHIIEVLVEQFDNCVDNIQTIFNSV